MRHICFRVRSQEGFGGKSPLYVLESGLFCRRGSTAVAEEMRITAQIRDSNLSGGKAPLVVSQWIPELRCSSPASLSSLRLRHTPNCNFFVCARTHTSRAQSFELRGGTAWPGCAQWMLQFSAKEGHGKVPNCRVGGGMQHGQAPCPPDALQIANHIFQGPPINLLSEWVLFRETES